MARYKFTSKTAQIWLDSALFPVLFWLHLFFLKGEVVWYIYAVDTKEDRDPEKLVQIETSSIMKKGKPPNPKHSKKGVTIECQRLNKNKVLEKINVEVSQEVFDALREMNPDMKIKNTVSRSWNVLELNSANFHLGKSLQEVKSIIHMLKSWANRASNYKLSATPKPIVTTL